MPELSVVIPTFNERTNLPVLVGALHAALDGINFEIIVVDDDSPDGTADLARSLAQTNPRVRIVQRIHRKGLSSAVIEGFMASSAPYMAVLDGDMQHDERILPEMFARIKAENLDLVIGTRNSEGGSMGDFSRGRVALSQAGRKLSQMVCHADLSDPMSGFFMVDRRFLLEVVRNMSSVGFKVLADLVASSQRPVRFAEVGYRFRERHSGESKLDILVGLEYLKLLADKALGDWVPVNFIVFSLVGALGVLFNLVLVYAQLRWFGVEFAKAQAISSAIVIAINFFFNNILTFRSRRLKGWRMVPGLILFYLACSVGLFTNVWLATTLREAGVHWAVSGAVGIVIGSIWNYWMTSAFVWKVNRRQSAQRSARAAESYAIKTGDA